MALQIGEVQKPGLSGLNRQAKGKQKFSLPKKSPLSKMQENMMGMGKKNRMQNKTAKSAYAKFMDYISSDKLKGIKKVDTLI